MNLASASEVKPNNPSEIFIATGIIWLLTFLFGAIPVIYLRCSNASLESQGGAKFRSGINCLVAGVFLGLSLLHMLPEVREQYHDAIFNVTNYTEHSAAQHQDEEYKPIPEISLLAGICLILLVEHLAHGFLDDGTLSLSENDETDNLRNETDSHCSAHSEKDDVEAMNKRRSYWRALTLFLALSLHAVFEGISFYQMWKAGQGENEEEHDHEHRRRRRNTGPIPSLKSAGHGHSHEEAVGHGEAEGEVDQSDGDISGDEFEVESSSINVQFYTLILGILFHKAIMAITLAFKLVQQKALSQRFVFSLILIFASMKPLGVAFSILVEDELPKYLIAILSGISAGTFIYIVFFEILAEEFGCAHMQLQNPNAGLSKIQKVLFFVAGIALISVMMMTSSHSH